MDSATSWAAYLHPSWMALTLLLVALALRAGLAQRRRRAKGLRRNSELLRRHLAYAKPAVAFVMLGFVGGAISSVQIRGWDAFASLHGLFGIAVMLLFVTAAVLGRQAKRGQASAALHGLVGVIATLFGAVTAMAGFILLP